LSHIGEVENILKLSSVYHVPELEANLISTSQLSSQGADVTFNHRKCIIKLDEMIAVENVYGNIYKLVTIGTSLISRKVQCA
jgi:hypothetical protein